MPPHEDAGADGVLTFRLHPLAVLKLSDRIREYQYQAASSSGTEDAPPPRMFGCVIGVRRGGTVEVSDTFDILHDGDPAPYWRRIRRSVSPPVIFRVRLPLEGDKKANPDLSVLGWYSIGTNVHARDYTDMQIHQACLVIL
uniref:Uncharacterized protein n=1 Tax=Oryza punctata TaxID=4537 RepID=A0A0E0MPR1_ORYPU